jgi:DNA modification methylase
MDYKEDLRKRLPELKKMEGFPVGEDEDIINLSNPPFFTACPNPYITEFLEKNGTKYDESEDNYHREPFSQDLSEGKTDPIYMAHTYHTKVPYKAIVKYIEHYTDEKDIVLDCFSGSGMTSVAAKMCNRNSIISDLSPIASFFGYSITKDIDSYDYLNEAKKILGKVNEKLNWIYKTKHSTGELCELNYIIWSQVLSCSFCNTEYVFWDKAFDKDENKLKNSYLCSSCQAELSKSTSNKVSEKSIDKYTGEEIESPKYFPSRISYCYKNKTYFKTPDEYDFEVIDKIKDFNSPYFIPTYKYLFKEGNWGDMWRSGIHKGITNVHHFFTDRTLIVLSYLFHEIEDSKFKYHLLYTLTSFLTKTGSKLHNVGFKSGKINLAGAQPNSLYIPGIYAERNIFSLGIRKSKDIHKALMTLENSQSHNIVQNCSATKNNIVSNSIDYVFTDPPFGDNLMYSEMNFIWESWFKVFTNNKQEAIVNKSQNKNAEDYFDLMYNSFSEYYRVLKPNRWITVVFHNSKSQIWNILQNSLIKAGFIISQVTILDKGQGTKNQMLNPGAVKSDLAISAFKPSKKLEEKFLNSSGQGAEIDFVYQFLKNQPINPILERIDKTLYSKLISFYIVNGYDVELDATKFYALLKENFIEEDGYWFTSDQINSYAEYKKKMKLEGIEDVKSGSILLFISDEKSAILWLYNFLNNPRTFSEIHSQFTQLASIQEDQVPELLTLLEDNFIKENNVFRRPTSEEEHSNINTKREKTLLREFESLLLRAKSEKKKIKEVRKEALVFGFEVCYKNKRFKDILTLEKRLDKKIIENSSELNDFVEAAKIMVEGIN